MRTSVVMIAGLAALSAVGCHNNKGSHGGGSDEPKTESTAPAEQPAGEEAAPKGTVTVSTGTLPVPRPDNSRIDLAGDAFIVVTKIRGEDYIPVEAAFDDASYNRQLVAAKLHSVDDAELTNRLGAPLKATIDTLEKHTGRLENVRVYPRYGFFTGLMKLERYQALGEVKGLPNDLVMSPVVSTSLGSQVRKMDQSLVDAVLADARSTTEGFSGLKSMGVTEFTELVQAEIGGQTPDGSLVKVGVTDTGVTYNHPSFEDANGRPRVTYMKDFTGEGRMYFNPAAKLEVSTTDAEDKLHVVAQVYSTGTTRSLPAAESLVDVEQDILVSPELKAVLLTAGSGAKLGVLSESVLQADGDAVDLNVNGKKDDDFLALLVPADGDYKLYLDVTGKGDFRKAVAVGDFNRTKQTMQLVAEKFGFDIRPMELTDKDGQAVPVVTAAIVGFDPGNHGSHVSGIIAGRKTIANDTDATLARGAAPNTTLMVNRVCANNGGCTATEAFTDLAQNGAEIINMSIGGLSEYNDGYSTQEIMIDRITDQSNVLFVISAGNSGPSLTTVGSPSTARSALSVGATAKRSMIERQHQWPAKGKPAGVPTSDDQDEDFMLFFSSRGPTAAGGFKPNITAPGSELSAVQLNTAGGMRSGLDVYWGTSMAAPSATGAIALLLDAAKRYNAAHPAQALPTDAATLRKVVIASARPFDVSRFDPSTGEYTTGQYTWIDQGTGMINLPNAWAALKAERDSRLPSPVYVVENGVRKDIRLDYQVRVLQTNPRGIPYDGSIELSPQGMALSGPRFGRGLWLDARTADSMARVQIARRLPVSAQTRDDVGELKRQLATTRDEFVLKTIYYGSNVEWLKAGSMAQLDCSTAPTAVLSVQGEGAIDDFDDTTGTSTSPDDSTLFVCLDRAKMAALPQGDQGALVLAYRKVGDKVEANPEFIVPVYVTIPHQTLAGTAGYEIQSTVKSFGVDRNYVQIPEGTSIVSVSLELKPAVQNGAGVANCGGVALMMREGGNTSVPGEIGDRKVVVSCSEKDGSPVRPEELKVSYSRANPRAGIWDLHVFGRYMFPSTDYTLRVDFAKVETSVTSITGTEAALNGSFDLEVIEASIDAKPDAEKSEIYLVGIQQTQKLPIAEEQNLYVPDADGNVMRKVPEPLLLTFKTAGSAGNDLDLVVFECPADATEVTDACKAAGQSAGATDVEKVSVAASPEKTYAALVVGYSVEDGSTFEFIEKRATVDSEYGSIAIEEGEGKFHVSHSFDLGSGKILKNPLFLSGKFRVVGFVTLRTETGADLTSIPVEVKKSATTH